MRTYILFLTSIYFVFLDTLLLVCDGKILSSECEVPLVLAKISFLSLIKLSPLLARPRIFSPSRKDRPRTVDEGLAPWCLPWWSFFVFSDELLGFLIMSSSKESKLSSAFFTVGELGSDIARSKASSMDKFCSRGSWELYFCLLKVGPGFEDEGSVGKLTSQCLFKSVSDLHKWNQNLKQFKTFCSSFISMRSKTRIWKPLYRQRKVKNYFILIEGRNSMRSIKRNLINF